MLWEIRREGEVWVVGRTTAGRIVAALWWALVTFPFAVVGGVLFFGFDKAGRLGAGVDVPWSLSLAVVLFAGFVSFVALVARLFRFRRWIIDREAGTIALSHRQLFADSKIVEVPLEELVRIEVRARNVGMRSELMLVFEDGSEEAMATTRLVPTALGLVRRELAEAFEGSGVSVDDGEGE